MSEVARRLAPEPSTERVVLLVRKGAGHTLRRGADRVEEGVAGPDADSTWDRLVLERGSVGLADEVLGYGADVYVEEPAAAPRPRRTPAPGGRRWSRGGRVTAPASAKDQVARLLTLVPYLHAHGEVRLDEAARALGVEPGPAVRRPQGAVHVRPAGRLPRRPDRRRHRRARGARTASGRTA